MNEKQAKRLRRAMRLFIADAQKSLAPGPRAKDAAEQLAGALRVAWPQLNHRQRGRVGRLLSIGCFMLATREATQATVR